MKNIKKLLPLLLMMLLWTVSSTAQSKKATQLDLKRALILCNECQDEQVENRIQIKAITIKAELLEDKIDDLITVNKIEKKAAKKAKRKAFWNGVKIGGGGVVIVITTLLFVN